MKKVLLIMAAALMTMTQCRKQETVPATPSADTIKMTITAGPGAKTNIDDNGAITWSEGDVLYVSDGTNWLGSLTLQSGAGNASGTFTGTIQGIDDGVKTCHFFYLGNGIVTTTPSGTTDVSISFASQDGSREGALKYHLGHGSADVTVSGGVATGAVAMSTEIAMAHLKLKMDSEPYPGSVTMDVSNTMTVNPNGTFSGSSATGITINKDGGYTTGDRYVTLIPTGTSSVDVSFSGSATGSMTFGHGIQANNLYGMENGIEVTLTKPLPYLPCEFSVSADAKVKFSKGNLYYDGTTDNKWKFEANQYDFRTYGSRGSCIDGTYNTSSGTPTNDWGLFGWSTSASSNNWGMHTKTGSTPGYTDGTFNDWGTAPGLPSAGESKTWRTLSKDEWGYLMETRPASTINEVADARYAEVKVNGVYGMMLFPDVFTWPSEVTSKPTTFNTYHSKWNSVNYTTADFRKLELAGVVFLPAAGYRSNTGVQNLSTSTNGYYWSNTSNDSRYANYLDFNKGSVNPTSSNQRYYGFSVRLVR